MDKLCIKKHFCKRTNCKIKKFFRRNRIFLHDFCGFSFFADKLHYENIVLESNRQWNRNSRRIQQFKIFEFLACPCKNQVALCLLNALEARIAFNVFRHFPEIACFNLVNFYCAETSRRIHCAENMRLFSRADYEFYCFEIAPACKRVKGFDCALVENLRKNPPCFLLRNKILQ